MEAQRSWKQVPVAERAAICRRMADWCVAKADALAEELTWQIGRPIVQSPGELKRGFHERALHMCEIAEEALSDIRLPRKDNFKRFIRREPLGVVFVIAPWNYPWLTSVNAVVPALLAGNSVILKMAAQTPLVAERYREAFRAAGLPDGVFQFLHLDHAASGRSDRRFANRLRRLHRLGRRRPRRAARRGRALHRHRPRARRQGPGLRARRRAARGDRRESRRRRVLQLRPVLLRRRAHLRRARRSTSLSSTPSSRSRASTGSATRSTRETTLGPMVRTAAADTRARSDQASARQGRKGAHHARRTRKARPISRRRCWSTSTTAWR